MTNIAWTDRTWNPVTGCSAVSPGCTNCYAAAMTRRLEASGHSRYQNLMGPTHFNGAVQCHRDMIDKPFGWKKPSMVFVNSMSDLFHPGVPFSFIAELWTAMSWAKRHVFQVLTKRPERLWEFFQWNYPPDRIDFETAGQDWLDCSRNIWWGTSCEDQATLRQRVPHLLKTPATVHFLSLEPLLGRISFRYDDSDPWVVDALNGTRAMPDCDDPQWDTRGAIDWVIVGCESGPNRRPCPWNWMVSIVDQCRGAGVAVFVKQLAVNADGQGSVYKHKPGDRWPSWVPSWARVQGFPK